MPYVVTFDWKNRRFSSADHFKNKNEGKWLKEALVGQNPRYVPVDTMEACPKGFRKRPSGDGCVR